MIVLDTNVLSELMNSHDFVTSQDCCRRWVSRRDAKTQRSYS